MPKLRPADELAEIMAQIARLKAREAVLRAAFLNNPAEPPTPRPGWPIRREVPGVAFH